jgi:hypothetical protein
MNSVSDSASTITMRLEKVTSELREIQELLISKEDAEPRILTDFRDAVNRVRNTAWAVEQYANSKHNEMDPQSVLSVLAGERIRVGYQLCKLIQADLVNEDVKLQKGPLLQFRDETNELARLLVDAVGKP